MKARIVFMFSGQGSQYAGMGQELYDRNPVFRRYMDEFSDVAFSFLGVHLANQICSANHPDSEVFVQTRYTNPALYMFNYAVAATLEAAGVIPDDLLGYSLGELTASAYNGNVDRFDLFIRLIRASFALEQQSSGGGMLAVLDSCKLWDRYPNWFCHTSLASVNCSKSFVVSGSADVLDQLQNQLRVSGILFQRLPVMQAFHSSSIDTARSSVLQEIDALSLTAQGRFSTYSCVAPGIVEADLSRPRRFWDSMRQPVLFETALQHLEVGEPRLYIDVGPSGTLAAFAKLSINGLSRSQALPVVDRFGLNERGLHNALVKAAAWRTF
ncbi:MAG: acyltransferase domain-containing protein [Nostoc sp.]|uniref:acyltransferase domain-containing protein n=1 Tax=Nostoc sp. TaxID=1180 RepID=UPI002FF9C541